MEEDDPFTQTYNALWELVERNPALTSLIEEKNRIKYDPDNPPKDNILIGDTPELILTASGISGETNNSNTGTGLVRTWSWLLTSGDVRINPIYHKIVFELYRSLIDYKATLCALTWKNCNFVAQLRLNNADEGPSMEHISRNVLGWCALWSVDVTYTFQISDLKLQV